MKLSKSAHYQVQGKLHTDYLTDAYGPIHADVLRHDDRKELSDTVVSIRVARLVDKKDILRTFAVTHLTYDKNDSELVKIDEEIRGGGLIGSTFRKHGFEITKNVLDVSIVDIPAWMSKDFQVNASKAKARLFEFYAKNENEQAKLYGTVIEIYSPDFKNPEAGINEYDLSQVQRPSQNMGLSLDEIWKQLASTLVDKHNKDEESKSIVDSNIQYFNQGILKETK